MSQSEKLSRLFQASSWVLRWIPRLLILLSLSLYVGYLLIYSYYALALFKFPFDYDQGEGFELVDTLMFSRFTWPYQSNDGYPFYSSNYPPVYHLFVVPLVWIFGPVYWTGRLIAYLGTLVTAGLIGFAVFRASGRRWLSALAGLAFLASNYVYHVGPLFRQHMFMVMWETLAVVTAAVLVDREQRSGKSQNRLLMLLFLWLLLAGYTKQLAYATVIAVFIFLFLRRARRTLILAAIFGAITVFLFALIDLATQGQWLINTVTANLNPYSLDQGLGLLRQWFTLHIVLVLASLALAVYELYLDRLSVFSIWFIVVAINGLASGKWGAGESYFATAIAAACIASGIAIGRLLNALEVRRRAIHQLALATIALLYIWQANLFFHMPTDIPVLRNVAAALGKPVSTTLAPQTSCSAPRPPVDVAYVDSAGVGLLGRPPTKADAAAGRRIVEWIARGDSAAFSEEAGFNLYLGRDVVTNPTQLLNLYNNDQVNLNEMLIMLDSKEFDTVVLRAQFYPPPVLQVIGQRYEPVDLVEMNGFVYCVLQPRFDTS